jgi:hypothetical protein
MPELEVDAAILEDVRSIAPRTFLSELPNSVTNLSETTEHRPRPDDHGAVARQQHQQQQQQ